MSLASLIQTVATLRRYELGVLDVDDGAIACAILEVIVASGGLEDYDTIFVHHTKVRIINRLERIVSESTIEAWAKDIYQNGRDLYLFGVEPDTSLAKFAERLAKSYAETKKRCPALYLTTKVRYLADIADTYRELYPVNSTIGPTAYDILKAILVVQPILREIAVPLTSFAEILLTSLNENIYSVLKRNPVAAEYKSPFDNYYSMINRYYAMKNIEAVTAKLVASYFNDGLLTIGGVLKTWTPTSPTPTGHERIATANRFVVDAWALIVLDLIERFPSSSGQRWVAERRATAKPSQTWSLNFQITTKTADDGGDLSAVKSYITRYFNAEVKPGERREIASALNDKRQRVYRVRADDDAIADLQRQSPPWLINIDKLK